MACSPKRVQSRRVDAGRRKARSGDGPYAGQDLHFPAPRVRAPTARREERPHKSTEARRCAEPSCAAALQPLVSRYSLINQRNTQLVRRNRARSQSKRLANETDLLVTNRRLFIVDHLAVILAAKFISACGGRVLSTEYIHQRGLSAP